MNDYYAATNRMATLMADFINEQLADKDATIAALRSELDQLREQMRWHKYPDEKPDDSSDKLVYTCFRERLVGYLDRGQWSVQGVTHWRPLPKPPEEEA